MGSSGRKLKYVKAPIYLYETLINSPCNLDADGKKGFSWYVVGQIVTSVAQVRVNKIIIYKWKT